MNRVFLTISLRYEKLLIASRDLERGHETNASSKINHLREVVIKEGSHATAHLA
jgi:hypothetical protein